MKAETYTNQGGSNMDCIEYKEGTAIEEIAEDLRKCYDNWDYAIIYGENGQTETVER